MPWQWALKARVDIFVDTFCPPLNKKKFSIAPFDIKRRKLHWRQTRFNEVKKTTAVLSYHAWRKTFFIYIYGSLQRVMVLSWWPFTYTCQEILRPCLTTFGVFKMFLNAGLQLDTPKCKTLLSQGKQNKIEYSDKRQGALFGSTLTMNSDAQPTNYWDMFETP